MTRDSERSHLFPRIILSTSDEAFCTHTHRHTGQTQGLLIEKNNLEKSDGIWTLSKGTVTSMKWGHLSNKVVFSYHKNSSCMQFNPRNKDISLIWTIFSVPLVSGLEGLYMFATELQMFIPPQCFWSSFWCYRKTSRWWHHTPTWSPRKRQQDKHTDTHVLSPTWWSPRKRKHYRYRRAAQRHGHWKRSCLAQPSRPSFDQIWLRPRFR